MSPRRARSLVTTLIVRGREAGTPPAAAARTAVSLFLSELGYTVQEQPFSFNGGIYRLMPMAAALLAIVSLLEIPLLILPGPAWCAIAALLVLAAFASLLAKRFLTRDGAPRSVRMDANLIAQRQGAIVRCWLVAHLDTKAQAHSMAGRLVALWVTVTALATLLLMAGLRLGGPQPAFAGITAGLMGILGGLLLAGGRLTGESPGACDNGSGLLAVLTAAELSTDPGIGIIITAAEEFGLAGARALAREHAGLFREADVVNVDTIDEEGTLFVVSHGQADRLAGRARETLAGLAPIRERRLPLGIMVDGVPLARVAAGAVTIGRLSWATLRRMHTPRDDAAGCSLTTAERLGERLAAPI